MKTKHEMRQRVRQQPSESEAGMSKTFDVDDSNV